MRRTGRVAVGIMVLAGVAATPAKAQLCNYRPSALLGQGAAVAVAATGGAVQMAGQAAGFYSLVQADTGRSLLSSAIASASAAGSASLIAGAGGLLGSAGAALMAPATVVVAGVAAVGAGSMEAACYLTDERVTDYDQILALMVHFAEHHPEDRFRLITGLPGRQDDVIGLWNPRTEGLDRHMVADLYVVNGTLRERRPGPDRNLGRIALVVEPDAPVPEDPEPE
ncbi:MAG: hypothetical protein ACXIU8_04835 [Alkalilacustris sp.]